MATLVFLCPSLDAKSMLRSIQNQIVLGCLKVFVEEFHWEVLECHLDQ